MYNTSAIDRATRMVAIVGLIITLPFTSAVSYITLRVPEYPSDNAARGQEGLNAIYALSHSLETPYDLASGLPTGRTTHKPLVVTKRIDKSTPGFYQALVNNELLGEVTLDLYRNNPVSGEFEKYYTILLTNVRIIGMENESPLTLIPENANIGHLENVKLIYESIHWTYLPTRDEAQANWSGPQP